MRCAFNKKKEEKTEGIELSHQENISTIEEKKTTNTWDY